MANLKINWDALGIGTSLACAIHCAILPLIVSSLPLFGLNIVDNIWFEWLMICLALAIGYYALAHGFKKHHRQWFPILLFSFGIGLLAGKQFFHEFQLVFLIPGVILIVWAHWLNYRLCRKIKHSGTCVHHHHD